MVFWCNTLTWVFVLFSIITHVPSCPLVLPKYTMKSETKEARKLYRESLFNFNWNKFISSSCISFPLNDMWQFNRHPRECVLSDPWKIELTGEWKTFEKTELCVLKSFSSSKFFNCSIQEVLIFPFKDQDNIKHHRNTLFNHLKPKCSSSADHKYRERDK